MHARPLARIVALAVIALVGGGATQAATQPPIIVYGSNPAAGNTFVFNGTRFYYETYGDGAPLLLIHGNGEAIGSFKEQIGEFANHHRVIAMDSRGQGKSELGTTTLTYEQMAEDTNALLDPDTCCDNAGRGRGRCTMFTLRRPRPRPTLAPPSGPGRSVPTPNSGWR
jgi:hypothetical protein